MTKLKNLLKENMLRFGTKNLSTSSKRRLSESNADLYNMAIQRIKKNPSESMSRIKSYKPTSQEDENDKNFYITFIQSVINKSPMTPADYIGKRLGYNMKLFNLLPL